jgi:hypothetical protein
MSKCREKNIVDGEPEPIPTPAEIPDSFAFIETEAQYDAAMSAPAVNTLFVSGYPILNGDKSYSVSQKYVYGNPVTINGGSYSVASGTIDHFSDLFCASGSNLASSGNGFLRVETVISPVSGTLTLGAKLKYEYMFEEQAVVYTNNADNVLWENTNKLTLGDIPIPDIPEKQKLLFARDGVLDDPNLISPPGIAIDTIVGLLVPDGFKIVGCGGVIGKAIGQFSGVNLAKIGFYEFDARSTSIPTPAGSTKLTTLEFTIEENATQYGVPKEVTGLDIRPSDNHLIYCWVEDIPFVITIEDINCYLNLEYDPVAPS